MNDQAANLRKKLQNLNNSIQTQTIAVISGKGGVGKSNFALNFSLTLTDHHKKVLLFDLDIGMGNVDILLGLSPENTIVDMFNERMSIRNIIEEGPKSLSYIAGGSGLTNIFNMDEDTFEYFLSQLEAISNHYDYIIFDMGAGVTNGSIYYMLAADECIVVTTPEPTSLTDAYAIIKHVSAKNNSIPIYLLVNRSFNRKQGQQTSKRLQHVVNQFLHRQIKLLGILPDDRKVFEAVTRQIPFSIYDPKAKISIALAEIVDKYVANNLNVQEIQTRSFVTRLKQLVKEAVQKSTK